MGASDLDFLCFVLAIKPNLERRVIKFIEARLPDAWPVFFFLARLS